MDKNLLGYLKSLKPRNTGRPQEVEVMTPLKLPRVPGLLIIIPDPACDPDDLSRWSVWKGHCN